MASSLLQPLNSQVPIVDNEGKPLPSFITMLQKLGVGTGLDGSSGTIALAAMAAKTILANKTVGTTAPTACTLSDILDFASSTRGSILYRGSTGWAALAPGTAGQFLKTNGAGADPSWAAGGGGGSGFGTVDVSAYGLTGGPLSAPTEVTDTEFGYGFSHAFANITTNNFWFRTRAFTGDLTIIARTIMLPQSNGNNSLGIIFRESAATKFVALLSTWNVGSYCEVSKSTNDGSTSTAATGSTSVALSTGVVPVYFKAVYVAGTNTLTMSVSLNGIIWIQLYSNTVDVTPNQVGFVQRIWSSTGPLPGGGGYKYFSDSGNAVKWNLP